MGRLFGTDGVRGVANLELSTLLAMHLGRVAGALLGQDRPAPGRRGRPWALVGCDTRVSGGMLASALTAGLTSSGVDVVRVGVVPTPGLSFLTRHLRADLGVMVSASHNPVEDNGIKLFGPDGQKIPDEVEGEIEALVEELREGRDRLPRPTGVGVGRVRDEPGLVEAYEDFLASQVAGDLRGLRMVVDCANGAAYEVAPRLFRRLGAEVVAAFTGSGGEDINVRCGSTHPEVAAALVRQHRAEVGLALDGDADRCIAIDEHGQVVDGDGIIGICALERLRAGDLPGRAVAVTVYSNGGLRAALAREEAGVVVTGPGDRQVLKTMRENGLVLGGEPSGHVIFLDRSPTGDGLLTGLMLLSVMRRRGQPLSALSAQVPRLPQVLISVRVQDRERAAGHPEVAEAVRRAQDALGPEGRVYVRPSGTEPVVRVMVEGNHEPEVRRWAEGIARALQGAGPAPEPAMEVDRRG